VGTHGQGRYLSLVWDNWRGVSIDLTGGQNVFKGSSKGKNAGMAAVV